jgi:formamidopyrimidine-DNA glycosylase
MPEAPEIFYLKELIKSKILNHKIKNIVSNTKSTVNLPKESKVNDVDCKGKLLWIKTKDYYIHLHMMISGWLVFEKPKINKYEFVFDNMTIYMDDQRRFSKVKIIKSEKEHQEELDRLGLSFIKNEVSKKQFIDIVSNSNKNISALMLDQTIFCGIGNYIRNEVLYMVKINPKAISNTISKKDIGKMYDKIRYVMFSNLYEMLQNDNLKIPEDIKKIAPKILQIPYKYRVYEKEKDAHGNKVTREKIAGRWAYYVKKLVK